MQQMVIERHQVSAEKIAAARDDFTNRIGSMTRSMSKAGPIGAYEWEWISQEMLDHLAALSVTEPALDSAEAWAILTDAAEAACAVVRYTAYHPWEPFNVFLDYVNFGISYDRGDDKEGWDTAGTGDWLDAYCLAVLADRVGRDGEAFHFARKVVRKDAEGQPGAELVAGFLVCVEGDLDVDGQEFPPTREAKVAAVDAALARIATRERQTGRALREHADTVALRVLRALVGGDREAYDRELTALLAAVPAAQGPSAPPRSLLPLVPLALAALGHRQEGWAVPVETGYLPRTLVTGFAPEGPRVGPFGRDRRADAVAVLAAGPVRCERPTWPVTPTWDIDGWYEEHTREDLTPEPGRPVLARDVVRAMERQQSLFLLRGADPGAGSDGQVAALRFASRLGGLLFRAALAEEGTEVRAECGGIDVVCGAFRGDKAGPGYWQTAVALALISGRREDLAPLVVAGPQLNGADGSAFATYREALHDYLRGVDPAPAAARALRGMEQAREWGFFAPPAVLLSQLVEGDEESFNLALLDALEAHRAHYSVSDRGETTAALLDLDVLALACHARRRGWEVRVESEYLPARLLSEARPV
ncbi:Imm49 family immunity protein [Streptomyces sp. NPDC004126]|uniref:immunity 49 family protein n=1 Tax=Streptomyces sp. NPDC004126 TaxID=3390695 RepID=UPI003D04C7D7